MAEEKKKTSVISIVKTSSGSAVRQPEFSSDNLNNIKTNVHTLGLPSREREERKEG